MDNQKIKKAKKVVELLLNETIKVSEVNPNLFIGSGNLANSIAFYKFSKYSNNKKFLGFAVEEFEKVYNLLSKGISDKESDIISGFGGVAWCCQYFINNGDFFIEGEKNLLEFFDKLFLERANELAKEGNYDLFYGILSYGNYFLLRANYLKENSLFLDKLVDLLYSNRSELGFIWTNNFSRDEEQINIGMAHGLTSQIMFCAKVYKLTKNPKALEIAYSIITFIKKYENKTNQGGFFPYFVNATDMLAQEYNTRLAWCYGDLTIGYAFLFFSDIVKDKDLRLFAIEILNGCSKLKIEDNISGVRDKSFCHGTSGIMYVYHKVINLFGLLEFQETRDYWLDQTLADSDNIDSYSLFVKVDNSKTTYFKDNGLIEGYCGIALALMGIMDNKNNEWEEIFAI